MVMQRGELWWADLPNEPTGSSPGFRRPVMVLQTNVLNQSQLSTVVVVVITSNLNYSKALGNVVLQPLESGLPLESVVNASQIITIDKSQFIERVGQLPSGTVAKISDGLRRVLEL
jgi:mRNA interferase MazF